MVHDRDPLVEISWAWGDHPAIDALQTDHHSLFYQTLSRRLADLAVPVPAVKVRASIGIPPGRGLGSSATAVIGGLLPARANARHTPSKKQRGSLVHAAGALGRRPPSDKVCAVLLGGLVVTSW